jgi:hypothetical protein
MRLSNTLDGIGTTPWTPFIPLVTGWDLGLLQQGQPARVYAEFRDNNGNISEPAAVDTIRFSRGPSGDISFSPHQDPSDGAVGYQIGISRVFDPNTVDDVNVDLESFQARLAYPDPTTNPAFPDGTLCVNIRDIRQMDFPITGLNIDTGLGGTTIDGLNAAGVTWPADLGHALTRLNGSAKLPCRVDLELTSLADVEGNPVTVPQILAQTVQRGDARADGNVTIADALLIARYLGGLRDACATVVETTCLHSVNAASVRQDGDFDRKTIADALFIAQYLVGLRDEFYNPVR